ncbi:hypothetical protein MBLNU459_g0260t1 [Dothideomycetes sp. NU459]
MSRPDEPTVALDSFQDPHDFYRPFQPPSQNDTSPQAYPPALAMDDSALDLRSSVPDYAYASLPKSSSAAQLPAPAAARSVSSPVRSAIPSRDAPASSPFRVVRSGQRPPIKDLVNRFNQSSSPSEPPRPPVNSRDRYHKTPESRTAKLQKARSPPKPAANGAGGSPFGAAGRRAARETPTITAAATAANVAFMGSSAVPAKQPPRRRIHKPLFGEVTYELSPTEHPGYGIPNSHYRRGSEDSPELTYPGNGHGRSKSDTEHAADHAQQASLAAYLAVPKPALSHKRSRSDLPAGEYHIDPRYYQNDFTHSGLPPGSSSQLSSPDRPSRIPISRRRPDSTEPSSPTSPQRRANMGQARNHFPSPQSPKGKKVSGKENLPFRSSPSSLPTLTSRRYDPLAQRQSQASQSLKAFISPQPPHKSPPLRSSRPRQPISLATTAASRAKSGQRFEAVLAQNGVTDGPSSDSNRRSKKTIPELGRVDFAERRAKIQRAISQNLKEEKSEQSTVSARSSISGAGNRRTSEVDPHTFIFEDSPIPYQNGSSPVLQHPQHPDEEHQTGLGLIFDKHDDPHGLQQQPPDSQTPLGEVDSPLLGEEARVQAQSRENAEDRNELSSMVVEINEPEQPVTILSQVMRMRERSVSSLSYTDFATDSSPAMSGSEMDDGGSIQIMLEGSPAPDSKSSEWPLDEASEQHNHSASRNGSTQASDHGYSSETVEVGSSPLLGEDAGGGEESVPETPRKSVFVPVNYDEERTPRQMPRNGQSSLLAVRSAWNRDSDSYHAVSRIASQYQTIGSVTPDIAQEFQRHYSFLSPHASDIDSADVATITVLLDSVLADNSCSPKQPEWRRSEHLAPVTYKPTAPRSPSVNHSDEETPGTAIIYDTSIHSQRESVEPRGRNHDFESDPYAGDLSPSSLDVQTPASQYVPFDEQTDADTGAMQEDYRPTPPPKDRGYSPSPRTSKVFHTIDEMLPVIRNSNSADFLQLPELDTGNGLGLAISVEPPSAVPEIPPPLPQYSPPPPPPPSAPQLEFVLSDVPSSGVQVTAPSSPVSTRPTLLEERFRNFSTPGARPSVDSQSPAAIPLPPSQSFSSFQSTARGPSLEYSSSPAPAPLPPSPNPELRRLTKRKNIIKELVDTENSYHQDMKIIEDIYKATVGDLITADDKKVLFGNADQVEAFSLEFYDALRHAVSSVYVPAKSSRWHSKRGSFSTNNSGSNDGASEVPDEEKDKHTKVGEVFERYVSRMEQVYAAYLKNHDGANQRLSKLQTDATVKCWLAECHNNASDITSAWDLDSLLVKPVQRILKYPLLLQQLLESTPASHPDYKSLEAAVKETLNVSHRINEAKKRADLVEQIVSRKRGQSDVRTGIAKAFGRRTEKLKERVGIAEAYQDPEFDELAHKFGGHFIRLQVCMRDVQSSLTELDKAVDHFSNFASALEAYVEVGPSTIPEIESKWRKFALAIRELSAVALPDHKAKIQRHVIVPMLTALELHKGPQNAIAKRKKRLIDFAKVKSMEKRGEKPDKKSIEACEMYEALNEQLKIDLPRLYSLTADLIKACLDSNVFLQTQWMWLWKEKIAPVIEYIPETNEEILPAFVMDFDYTYSQVLSLGICNGSLLSEVANFLSPQTTLVGDERSSREQSRRPSALTVGKRAQSMSSEHSPMLHTPEYGKSFGAGQPLTPDMPVFPTSQPGAYSRMRSNSSLSNGRGRTPTPNNSGAPAARMPSQASKSSFSASRPSTATTRPADLIHTNSRASIDPARPTTRPGSGASYFTAHQDVGQARYSGVFSSAMPMTDSPSSAGPVSPMHAPDDTPVMFVAASLFEFNIDRARREAGYPYLTYVEGEVFDVIAQKGELWLAKNQDDATNSLGWIWEQHFVILSQDS